MSTETDDTITDTDRLWIALAVAVLAVAAWANRSAVLAAAAPYGLAEPNRTPFHGDPFNPEAVTGWRPAPGWHLTTAGWIAAAILAAGVVGLAVCVIVAAAWVRWWRRGGVDAVPIIPASAAAAVLGAATFGLVLILASRLWLAGVIAAAVAVLAWPRLAAAARRQRTVMAFAARADQVLGHGHPAPGRVRARKWRREDGGQYPAEIDAMCGPGWQHAPGELAELSRYAREVGWPGYEWRYDPMRKRVTGTTATP